MTFEGKNLWITGASSGIGAAFALEAARRGARLILSARRRDALEAVRQRCEQADAHLVLPLDLERPDTLPAAAAAALDRAGHIDVLVNNGGLSQRSRAMETEMAVVRRLMEINFMGTVALTQAVLPSMVARGMGRIVVVSSVTGKVATPYRSGYAATKHALHGYFDALRAELEDTGVGVTLVCPGYVRTELSLNALTADGSRHERMDTATANGLPPDVFSRKMARAILREKNEVYIGRKEVVGVYLKRYTPWLLDRIIGKVRVR